MARSKQKAPLTGPPASSGGVSKAPEASSTRLDIPDVTPADGITRLRRLADNALCPAVRATISAMPIAKATVCEVDLTATLESLRDTVKAVQAGDMGAADTMLVSQAETLDGLFHLLVARSSANSHAGLLQASETYMRLALKAQSQARATWESLSRFKNPPAATFIRQANVANGHQQVNNGAAPAGRAEIFENEPNKLQPAPGRSLAAGAASDGSGIDTRSPTVAEIDRTADCRR